MMTEVFFSGGVRRGSDILKACAFGANGVFLDPEAALWGLFQGHEAGLESQLSMINDELKLAMVLTHCAQVDEITEKQVVHMLEVKNVLVGKL